jgi:peroxiredoxin
MRIFFLIFLSFFFITTQAQNNLNRGYKVTVGDQAPKIDLKLLDGQIINNENIKGKVVVFQFTASWCSVCIKEMPHLEKEVWQRFKEDDFLLIGVDLMEDLGVVKEFILNTEVTYPFTIDSDGSFFESFTLPKAGVTRNIVLDQEGKISFLTRLYNEKEFAQMIEHIDQLLK